MWYEVLSHHNVQYTNMCGAEALAPRNLGTALEVQSVCSKRRLVTGMVMLKSSKYFSVCHQETTRG